MCNFGRWRGRCEKLKEKKWKKEKNCSICLIFKNTNTITAHPNAKQYHD